MQQSGNLSVYWGSELVGRLSPDGSAGMTFTYDSEWIAAERPAISLSLPVRAETYHAEATACFGNLLPEGGFRQKLETLFQVSSGNDFSLLTELGGDCAGALVVGTEPPSDEDAFYAPVSDEHLRQILASEGARAFRQTQGHLRLSLAGAQGKLPVGYDKGELLLPYNGAPSTHVLKFNRSSGAFPRLVENEFFLTQLAREAGLSVINQALLPFEGHVMLLARRYDRSTEEGPWPVRIHQEDLCQALGVPHFKKYEKEGGPGFADCTQVFRDHLSLPEKNQLVLWSLFNFLTGNSDAHGKNLSVLHEERGPRLAPFYDLVCTRAYDELTTQLAMSIGDRFDPDTVGRKQWELHAQKLHISYPYLRRTLSGLTQRVEAGLDRAKQALRDCDIPDDKMQHVYHRVEKQLKAAQETLEGL